MLGGVAKLLESISSSKKKLAGPKESLASERHAQQLLHPAGLSVPDLNPNRLRVVVFRDDKGVKQPIFDSQQFTSEEGEEQCTQSLCDMRHGESLDSSLSSSSNGIMSNSSGTHSAGWITQSGKSRRGLLAKRPSTDSELLGEMMFGSMPMKVIGNTVKVHYIRSTDQLMLSKVFTSQRKLLAQCSLVDPNDSCPLSYSPGRSVERSFGGRSKTGKTSPDGTHTSPTTLSVPIASHRAASLNSSSTYSPPSPVNSLTVPGLASSYSRRIQRSRSTSLENASELYRKVLKPLDQPNGSARKKRKYAIGFIVCLSELSKTDIRHFQSFLFSHFTLIDAHLERLKMAVEEAYTNRHLGVAAEEFISRAYETFLENFLSLYSAPRIESPAWLSLVSHVDRRKEVCMRFMEELASAIMELDTKETKFFLSSLLTAVLSHHLAWIFTVSHQHSSSDSNRHSKHPPPSKSLGVLAESHPYNPLWAQLGDLFGSVSHPLKIARTVITGRCASIVRRLLYLLTYFIRCSEVEPGFSTFAPEQSSSPANAVPSAQSRTAEVNIPTPSSSCRATASSGTETSLYDVSQLNDTEVFGSSRASSVTVISENDRHSLLSPFASPVNADTPIVSIRPHPFGIRTSLVSPSDHRKGNQSESDSLDSLNFRVQPEAMPTISLRQLKKIGSSVGSGESLMTSQASLKKNSPLLSSARQTSSAAHKADCNRSEMDPAQRCNCHYGNPTTCATVACCESMGMCPIRDGFLTFDPIKSSQNPVAVNRQGYGMDDEYSISHLASCGLLGPSQSLESNSSSVLPSHASFSSLDSGYDQSWSLTNSSRNSCTEFAGSLVCSVKNHPPAEVPTAKCLCNEGDSGRGSQCSCQKDKGYRRALQFADTEMPMRSSLGAGKSFPAQSWQRHRGCNDSKLPIGSLPNVAAKDSDVAFHGEAAHLGSDPSVHGAKSMDTAALLPKRPAAVMNSDPTSSLFPLKVSKLPHETPLSPDSVEESSPSSEEAAEGMFLSHCDKISQSEKLGVSSLEAFAVSSDPLAPVPMRKIKNHIRAISQAKSDGNVNLSSSNFTALHTANSDLCTDENCLEKGFCKTTPETGSISHKAGTFGSNFGTSSLPISRAPATSLLGSAPSASLTLQHSTPLCVIVGDPCATSSICSEVDSGRGTKSSLKTGDFDTHSLSHISEMSYECEPESSLNLTLCRSGMRANSSPPQFDNRPGLGVREEEYCSLGGCLSFPSLSKPRGAERKDEDDGVMEEVRSSKLNCTRSLSDPPSVLHQQLHQHDQSLIMGARPSTLEQFDNFTDVPLPDLEEFHLDMPTHGVLDEQVTHRHQMSDFGHSLFVGLSPRYLPDFVLHGTTESADMAFQDKLLKDLAHTVKYSIIDEPVEYGVGIVADTDNWTVKVMAASKSVQTSDVIYGTGTVQAAKCIKHMLSSVKNMHCLRMPAEFCLSYVEDSLMSLNDRSIMLADALLEKGGNTDFTEALPKVADSLSISPSDISLLLPIAAVNCQDLDMAFRFNHLHMQQTLGKHFV